MTPTATVLEGHVITKLQGLEDNSVDCIVTSIPYWGLRSYGTEPQVWGGETSCEHDWVSHRYYTEQSASKGSGEAFHEPGQENADRLKAARWREDDTCSSCGAWRGELGLEPSPYLFVEHIVQVFEECRRVLKEDGDVLG